VGGLPEE
jgi:hypothetical protein